MFRIKACDNCYIALDGCVVTIRNSKGYDQCTLRLECWHIQEAQSSETAEHGEWIDGIWYNYVKIEKPYITTSLKRQAIVRPQPKTRIIEEMPSHELLKLANYINKIIEGRQKK